MSFCQTYNWHVRSQQHREKVMHHIPPLKGSIARLHPGLSKARPPSHGLRSAASRRRDSAPSRAPSLAATPRRDATPHPDPAQSPAVVVGPQS
ncbi:hypothetical protein NL676_008877 [Syzygium grande]|nr:hypothetical protein NL676_008877 [Syzygium grande]